MLPCFASNTRSIGLDCSLFRAKIGDLEESCRAYVEENTQLKKKLSESENNVGELKRKFEELILEKSGLMERAEDLKNENSKILAKLHTEEGIVY